MSPLSDQHKHKRKEARNNVSGNLTFALGFGTAFLLSIILWGISSASENTFTRQEMLAVAPTLGTLVVALISIYLSYYALSEQRKARQAGTDPVILVHLGSRRDAPMLTTLEITNVGAGAARNVKVLFDAESVQVGIESRRILTDVTKIGHPIRVIPQEHSVSYNFGAGHLLLQAPVIPPIRVDVSYEDIDGTSYSTIQWIDVRELHFQRADTPIDAKISKSLEEISKEIKKLSSIGHVFRATTQPIDDYRREKEFEREEMLSRFRQELNKEQ
jgi:hypothetical protein